MNYNLYDLCFVCSTSKSGRSIIRFIMSVRDAIAFCSDKRTHHKNWSYGWRLFEKYKENEGISIDMKKISDSNSGNEIISELGLTKIPITAEILNEYGFIVKETK